jgi:hypothetical protein
MLVMTQAQTPRVDTEIGVEPHILARVLAPYKPHCRYLQSASVSHAGAGGAVAAASGAFAIPDSCYIASTGHFNAVEFNICYNQLTYCLLATCIDENVMKPFAGWSLADFSRRQLSSFLIARFFSAFHKPLAGGTFEGRVEINQVAVRRGTTFMKTTCQFFDDGGGRAEGGATIAIVDGGHA